MLARKGKSGINMPKPTRPHVELDDAHFEEDGTFLAHAKIPEKWGYRDLEIRIRDIEGDFSGFRKVEIWSTNVKNNGKRGDRFMVDDREIDMSRVQDVFVSGSIEEFVNNYFNTKSRLLRSFRT